jgi:hypothetical protein
MATFAENFKTKFHEEFLSPEAAGTAAGTAKEDEGGDATVAPSDDVLLAQLPLDRRIS